MRNLMPSLLHRLALRTAHTLRLAWWRATQRTVRGTNVIAADAHGRVLLVRHSYHASQTWMLPGGGLGTGESALDAASRELAEETGCTLIEARQTGGHSWVAYGWNERR